MRIATKLNIGVFTVFAATVLANYAVLEWTIKPKFDEIEVSEAKRNHDRVLEAIDTMSATLRASAQDYAFWDACFDFAQGIDTEKFMQSTLSPADKMLENVSVDVAVFFDSNRKILWAAGVDQSSDAAPAGLVADIVNLEYRHPYLSGTGEAVVTSGIISTSKGVALVAVSPILKSDHTGTPAGTLLMAKLFNESAVQKLTSVSFALSPAKATDTKEGIEHTGVTGKDTISSASLLHDIMGRPFAVVTSHSNRHMSKVGAEAINYAVLLMMLAAGLVIMALWLFVRLVVARRLSRLTTHFASAVDNGRICEHRTSQGNDEIGHLATTFNRLATQVNDMRDELADSAYLNGMSEWASGTLHNVRNSLMPMNMHTLKLQEIFDKQWCTNLSSAVEQLADPATAPERRAKLLAYVSASGRRLAHSVDTLQEVSENIMSCSRSIEEMIVGYENFAQKDIRREKIEMRDLLASVAKMTCGPTGAQIDVSLPERPTFVWGNRIILRQIAANILLNAGEAMQDQQPPRRISIDFRASNGHEDQIEIRIHDNGEGIAPDKLKTIFERGYSTRDHKKGGLGLHWCANAVNAMGGSLWAESQGARKGATLILRLPQVVEAERGVAA